MLFAFVGTFIFNRHLSIDPSPQIRRDFWFIPLLFFSGSFYFFWRAFQPQIQGRLFISIVVNAVSSFFLSWAVFVAISLSNLSDKQASKPCTFTFVAVEKVRNKKTGILTEGDYTYYLYLTDSLHQHSCYRFDYDPIWYPNEKIVLKVKKGRLGYYYQD